MEKRCEKEGPKVPRPSVTRGFPGCFGAPGGDIEGGKQGYKDQGFGSNTPWA